MVCGVIGVSVTRSAISGRAAATACRWRPGYRAGLADALHAARGDRRGRLQRDDPHLGHLVRGGRQVVGDRLPVLAVADLLRDAIPMPWATPPRSWPSTMSGFTCTPQSLTTQ